MNILRPIGAVALLVLLSGCAISQRPAPSSDLNLSWTMQEPTRSQPEGRLFFTDEGFWGYQPKKRDEFSPDHQPMDLVIWDGEDGLHLFAIIESARWGYRLQRLDDRPLKTESTGELRAFSPLDASKWAHLCIASPGVSIEEACSPGKNYRRWRIFVLDEPAEHSETPFRLHSAQEATPPPSAFPAQPVALFGADPLSTSLDGEDPTSTYRLAIPSDSAMRSQLVAQVVYDPGCSDFVDPRPSLSSRILWREASEPLRVSSGHPLEVEELASRHNADAMIACGDEGPRLLTPLLSRPLFRDQHRFTAAPSIGLLPRDLHELSPDTAQALVIAGALTAVGDHSGAAFWISQALQNDERSTHFRDFALSSMTLLVAGGQPELALRMGRAFTARGWNPENVPDFLDGMILLLGEFQMPKEQKERIDRRANLTRQSKDLHRNGFYRWTSLRLGLAHHRSTHGPAFEPILNDLEEDDLEEWALALWATIAMAGAQLPRVDDPMALLPRFRAAGAEELWLRTHGASLPLLDLDPSSPDLFSEELRLQAPSLLASPFALSHLRPSLQGLSPAEKSAILINASPLAPASDLEALMSTALDSLRLQLIDNPEAICSETSRWETYFRGAAARGEAPVMDRQRRQWLISMQWWAHNGVQAVCSDYETLLAAIEKESSESNPWTRMLLPILEDRLLRSPSAAVDLEIFRRAAQLSRTLDARETCTLWNLGMSIGAARGGYLDAAGELLISATNCIDNDPELRRARNLVEAYIDFERAAGRNIARDGSIERALAAATRKAVDDPQACIGLLPLGFNLESQLPSSVIRIAERVQLTPMPHDGFGLRTASGIIEEAQAAYLSGIRDLQRGQIRTAARALSHSLSDFRRLGHLPGLTRVDFLDQVIFAGKLAALADGDEVEFPAESPEIQQIRRGEAHLLLEDSGLLDSGAQLSESLLAALLIYGREEELILRHRQGLHFPENFCEGFKEQYYLPSEADEDLENGIELIRSP